MFAKLTKNIGGIMIAKDLIEVEIAPLRTSDSAVEALSLMDEFRVSHLPIVNEDELLGLLSEEDIYEMTDLEAPIGSLKLNLNKVFVYHYQFLFDVLKLMTSMKLTLLPVVDQKERYLGSINLVKLTHRFGSLLAVDQPGGVIILEMNENDYYASQIAQIVESDDAKILSLLINALADSTKIEVILKINKMDLRPIIATFERYGYQISASIFDSKENELDERFDLLMKYIDI